MYNYNLDTNSVFQAGGSITWGNITYHVYLYSNSKGKRKRRLLIKDPASLGVRTGIGFDSPILCGLELDLERFYSYCPDERISARSLLNHMEKAENFLVSDLRMQVKILNQYPEIKEFISRQPPKASFTFKLLPVESK